MSEFYIDNSQLQDYGIVLLGFDVIAKDASTGEGVLGYSDHINTSTVRGLYARLTASNTTFKNFTNAVYFRSNDYNSLNKNYNTTIILISTNQSWIAGLEGAKPYLYNYNHAPLLEDYTLNNKISIPDDITCSLINGEQKINSIYQTSDSVPVFNGKIKKDDILKYTTDKINGYNEFKIINDSNWLIPNYRYAEGTTTTNYTYSHSTIPEITKQNINFSLSNCSVDYSDTTIPLGKHTFTFTADNGFYFTNYGHLTYVDSTDNSTKSIDIVPNNEKTNTLDFEVTKTTTNINIILSANTKPVEPTLQDIKFHLTNCTVDYSDTTIPVGEHTFTFTANDGYIFKSNGTISWYDGNIGVQNTKTIPINNSNTLKFTFEVTALTTDIEVTLNGILQEETISRFSNLYKTTDIELNNLSHERMYVDSTSGFPDVYDYGSFITDIYKIPFNIDNSNLGDYDQIVLGIKKSQTRSTRIINNNLIIDIGSIDVPEEYKNAFDYLNTTVNLFLPVVNKITLNVYDVINNTIYITYNINLYNGMCTITIKNNQGTIYYGNQNIATDIPFMQEYTKTVSSSSSFPFINDIKQAYVVIDRPKPIVAVSYPTREQGLLKDYTGKVAIDDINLNCNATQEEYNNILRLLKNGVTIK